MKVITNIIKFILAIILTMCIMAVIIVNVASSTMLNKEFILQKLDETNYYANTYTAVENDFENYIYQSGLDEEVLKDIVSPEKIEKDTKIIISNMYDGTDEQIDITEIENNLEKNIEESLDQKLTMTQQKMVDEFVNKITEQYKKTITSTNYEDTIHNLLSKGNNVIEKVKQLSIIGIVISSVVMLLLSFRRITTGFMFIMASTIASGAFYIIANVIIHAKVKIQNITILNDAISISLREVIQSILNNLNTTGLIIAVLGIIGLIIFAFINSYNQGKGRKEEQTEE